MCIVSGETSEGPVRGAACSPWVLGVLQPRPGAVAGTLNIGAGWAPGLVLLTCVLLAGAEAKTILPKKEKLKLRRERWLQSKLPRPVLSCPVLSCRVPGGLLSWAGSELGLWVVWALEEAAACATTGRWPHDGGVALSPVRGSARPYLTPHQECHYRSWVKRAEGVPEGQ